MTSLEELGDEHAKVTREKRVIDTAFRLLYIPFWMRFQARIRPNAHWEGC